MIGLTIRITLENEDGSIISDLNCDSDVLAALLPSQSDAAFRCLCFVDPTDNARFNHCQMKVIVEEVALLRSKCETPAHSAVLDAIEIMACDGAQQIHVYLNFYGD